MTRFRENAPSGVRIFESRLQVQWADVDVAGIMYFAAYSRFAEYAEMRLFAQLGFPYESVFNDHGFWLPRVRVEAEYYAPSMMSDWLRMRTHIEHVGRSSVRWQTVFFNERTRRCRRSDDVHRRGDRRDDEEEPSVTGGDSHGAARMRVAMLVEPRRIELREEPAPVAPPGGILVRIRAALTDGTDLKAYRRGHPKMPMPTRFGHEFSGDIVAIGDGVTAFSPSDGVMCVHTAPCGSCFWCLHSQEELCESLMPTMLLGAYSDLIAVPKRIVDRNCFRKPDDVSYAHAAFLEPLACVVHSIATLAPARGSTVAILGNGGFGILHALLLERAGIKPILFGRRRERLELASALGLQSVDTRTVAIREFLCDRTQGRGADAAIECTGSTEMWESAPSFVRRGGRVSFFAGLPAEARVSFQRGAAALRRNPASGTVSLYDRRRSRGL